MSSNKQNNSTINSVENEKEVEDVMLKKNKKSFSKIIKTALLMIILVLIADFAILLMLNKIGQVNINRHIQDIPLLNVFTNTQDTIDPDKELISELTAERDNLSQLVKSNESELSKALADNEALKKELQTLKEHIEKLENTESDEYKLADYYSKMKPKAAAEALNEVNATVAIRIFEKMKDSEVGAIMQNMLPEKVAAISKVYDKSKQ